MKALSAVLCCIACCAGLLTPALAAETPGDKADPNLPQHKNICEDGFVSSKKLAFYLLVNVKNTRAVLRMTSGRDSWRKIFTDANFCPTKSVCDHSPNSDACKAATECNADQNDALNTGIAFFTAINDHAQEPSPAYVLSERLRALHTGSDPHKGTAAQLNLFMSSSGDTSVQIICSAKDAPAPAPPYDPAADQSALSKLRARGLSDDLWIDRTQGNLFKGTTPVTGSYSGNTNTPGAHTSTGNISGALGYAFDTIPQTQIVPYVSLSQSVTATESKPTVINPTNNVAFGVLGERYFIDTDYPAISHMLSLKPQYLFNTANDSQIASARIIYAPWIDSPIFNLNTFRQLAFIPGLPWVELLFDLRNDSGIYPNRGNTPAVVKTDTNFDRAGTRVGFALTTDNFPSLTLAVNAIFLDGFAGYYRSVNSFQTSLTYNIINSYFGITAAYQNGRDENTAIESQMWTIGLSARY